jgi:hypothetical protein
VPLVWELDDGTIDTPLAMWADLLRVVPDRGALQRDLLALAHVSPRSMNVLVSKADRLGLVTTEPAPKGGPVVRRTKAGDDACRAWERRLTVVETRWRREHGTEPLESALRDLLGGLDMGLPWLLLPYGPADNSASVGPPTTRDQSPDELPLLALLSQVLAAFTLAYESHHGWMLSMMSTAFDGFPDDGMPMSDVHPFAGVKGNGKTLHERHGIVTVDADPDQPKRKIVRLTDKGRRLRDRHRPVIDVVERERAGRHGPEDLAAVRRTLEEVVRGLPSGHVRHLCMEYGRSGFTEVSPRPAN